MIIQVVMFLGGYAFWKNINVDNEPKIGEFVTVLIPRRDVVNVSAEHMLKVISKLAPVGEQKIPRYEVRVTDPEAGEAFLKGIVSPDWEVKYV